jgi:hypothetical protein
MDRSEATAKSAWGLLSIAAGCAALAPVPAILSAFDQEIDRVLKLADAWPDFWTLLDQIEPWWGGGLVAGVILIGGRALVIRLQNYAALHLVGEAVWWLALAVAPALLFYFAIHRGPGHPALGSGLRLLVQEVVSGWFFGALLLAVFLGGRKLRDRSNMVSHLAGTILCGLTLVIGPAFMVLVIDTALTDFYHRFFSSFDWFAPLWVLWVLLLIVFAVFEWNSKQSRGWRQSAS